MDNKIIYLEDYKYLLKLQEDYENELITEEELTMEELDSLIALYKHQIKVIENNIKTKILKKSGEKY